MATKEANAGSSSRVPHFAYVCAGYGHFRLVGKYTTNAKSPPRSRGVPLVGLDRAERTFGERRNALRSES